MNEWKEQDYRNLLSTCNGFAAQAGELPVMVRNKI